MAKKIFLIDDETDFTELAKSVLSFNGFEVETSNDPKASLKKLLEGTYDAVVVDLMMPDMDGFSLVRNLRRDGRYAQTPIFVMSAKKLKDEERKALLLHNVQFVPKPFEPNRLVELIKQAVPPR